MLRFKLVLRILDTQPHIYQTLNIQWGFGPTKLPSHQCQRWFFIPYSSVVKTDDPDLDLIWPVRGSYALSEEELISSDAGHGPRRVNPNKDLGDGPVWLSALKAI
ncbi:hypothetical protein OK016_24565 [Vibrio chagasii]|nr:hypothetical protein [Vibrio chagasii]